MFVCYSPSWVHQPKWYKWVRSSWIQESATAIVGLLCISIVLLSLIVLYFPESVRKNAVSVKTFIKLFMTSKQQQSSLLIFHFRLFKRCTVPQTPSILFLKFVMYEVQTHFQWFKLHLFAEWSKLRFTITTIKSKS